MEQRMDITEVAAQYQISARTLRYYEEAGLLQSHRKPNSKYREYDRKQCQRLEIILLLRRLSFSIKEIQELLCGDNTIFYSALQKKIAVSGNRLMEAREVDRLLHNLDIRLSHKAPSEISISEVLGEYIYLTKKTERMISMSLPPHKEKYRIALGYSLAIEVANENGGDLLGKITRLRSELEKESITFPMLRVYDSEDLAQTQALIVWNGEEIWRADYSPSDAIACADAIIAQLKEKCLKR